jgi:pyruvate dehydrogenase E1 component alpha subunit
MAFRIRRQPRCAVCYIGDGGTSQGAFHEAVNLAGAQQLPVVFVIVNNGWAISVPASAQTAAQTFAQKGLGNGVPGIQVDGNDVIGVRKVLEDALACARRGGGATVVEAVTYRLSDHTTADDASRYRPAAELEAAWQLEPLLRTRRYVEAQGWWDDARETALRAECTARIDAAVHGYQHRAPVTTDHMFEHLFAHLPAQLAAQRALARRYGADVPGH